MDIVLIILVMLMIGAIFGDKEAQEKPLSESAKEAIINKAVQFVEFQEEINQAKKQAKKRAR